jgi:hypothetical protein
MKPDPRWLIKRLLVVLLSAGLVGTQWPETPTLLTYPAPCQGIGWN